MSGTVDKCWRVLTRGTTRFLCGRPSGHLGSHRAGALAGPEPAAVAHKTSRVRSADDAIGRPDLHRRFAQIVQRASERAEREEREHMASLRSTPRTKEEARLAQRRLQERILYDRRPARFGD